MADPGRAYADGVERLRARVRRPAVEARRTAIDRAVGLIAGRVGCRLEEAHAQLARVAGEQGRDLGDVATGAIELLEDSAALTGTHLMTATDVDRALRARPRQYGARRPAGRGPGGRAAGRRPDATSEPTDDWTATVREVLEDDARREERIEQTERLGNLGWGEWDLTNGRVEWSDQLYRIYERDPAEGPMPTVESEALTHPEDMPVVAAAAESFLRGERFDAVYRARINGRLKHLRAVVDATRDATGQPVKIYGIIQDVTVRETTLARLAEVERRLAEQQRTLEAEHRLASELQNIILPVPDHPIDLPGLRVALRYLPAEQLSHVGGDWYHAAALPDGRTLLAIGDVAGHGVPAATTMAQLRHALRALTVTTTTPSELMTNLDRLMCDIGPATAASTATAVIACYDPAARSLTWCQAGHPPPLLTRGGRTVPLPRPAGVMLGVTPAVTYRSETVRIEPDNVLLLYTDGLVEHRSHTIDEGLAAVIEAVDAALAASPDLPLSALIARLRRANSDDDTFILAARPQPPLADPAAGRPGVSP